MGKLNRRFVLSDRREIELFKKKNIMYYREVRFIIQIHKRESSRSITYIILTHTKKNK